MSQIILDFNTLKFNLYEILGLESDASESKIKKSFRNLILNFHPDKNNSTEEEIYYHIITANQILNNKESRKKYDNFLNKLESTHDELKNTYNKNGAPKLTESKDQAQQIFFSKFKELEKKHLSNIDCNSTKNYDKLVQSRETEINIPNENIRTSKEFNNKFEERIVNGTFNDQLIPVTENMKLSCYNVNDNYTSLDLAFDNLYIDGGGISSTKFSSLDTAFKLQPINPKQIKEINSKKAIEEYNNVTNDLTNIKYSKDKYELW
jgi:curved DNA-binding protein CbpA